MGYYWPGNIRELKNVVERIVLQMTGPSVELEHLPRDLVRSAQASGATDRAANDQLAVSHHERVDALMRRLLVDKESFWTSVYAMYMSRDITRDDLRYFVRAGLEQTRGSYRLLVALFNMAADDYRRFLGFLKQHDCHIPFQGFRMTPATVRQTHPSIAGSSPVKRADGSGL